MNSKSHILIVGAGPAGLMAAISAARSGAPVVLLEKQDRCGRKLQAAGGGRANLANTADNEAFMARFGRQGRFMAPALAAMDARGLRAFLDEIGVPTYDERGRVFPRSNSAAAVRSALETSCRRLGVEIRTASPARRLLLEGAAQAPGRARVVGVAGDGWSLPARAVVLACGSPAYPSLGGCRDGLELAAQAGHAIVLPTPALVGLVCRESWPGGCAGVSLADARVWIARPGHSKAGVRGEVLFTHRGLSGPAVLDISGEVAALLARLTPVPIALEFCPDVSADQWRRRLDAWRRDHGARTVRTLLDEHLPARLARALCELAGLAPLTDAAHVTNEQRERLLRILTGLELAVTGTAGLDGAMVARGGVVLREVEPGTLESRLCAGLFFAGELLDLDGPTGGYNLQWALVSGSLAGQSAGNSGPPASD